MHQAHRLRCFPTFFYVKTMIELHDSASFLELQATGLPVLDVRSPGEFARGHIPGALNLPIFTDDERAQVGTAHARSGTDAAVHLALNLVGGQLASKLEQARHLARHGREVLLYCWRGGMRSGSMAWLLETGGFRVHRLIGGYKTFRGHVREVLGATATVLVLGGMTGCGKTDMLHELAALGSQVIDLEGLAGHRGSSFGGVGLGTQPSNEWVENAVFDQWRHLDLQRPIWMEDEGRRIGTVTLSSECFAQLDEGRLVLVDVPLEDRVQRLTRMYTEGGNRELDDALSAALWRIEARLGNEACRRAVQAVEEGRHEEAVRLVLDYYDRAYTYQIEKRQHKILDRVSLEGDVPAEAARRLREVEASLRAFCF